MPDALLSQIEPVISWLVVIGNPLLTLFCGWWFGRARRIRAWLVVVFVAFALVLLDWVLVEHLIKEGLFVNEGGYANLAPLLGVLHQGAATAISLAVFIITAWWARRASA